MELVTYAQLRKLLETGAEPCVSIFMPTHRQGRDTRQDPTHLKNLLREAEDKLVTQGMRGTEARDLLEPARLLLDDPNFWQFNDQGLAIYIGKGIFRAYKLPVDVEDTCFVNTRFEIKPLLPLLEGKLFYVLAVSLNDARLLECTPHGCHVVPLPTDVSLNKDEAVGADEENPNVNMTSHATGGGGSPSMVAGAAYGHADDLQNKVEEDERFYFRQLDEGVRRVMGDLDAPVVIAGVDKKVSVYREKSQLRNIAEAHIQGNPEHVDNAVLHEKAMQILEPMWRAELTRLQEQYGNATGKGLASCDVPEIVRETASGRVGILFVSPRATFYGKFDENALVASPADQDDPEAEDLIDRATVNALMTGAQVVVCEPEQIPGNQELGAIFRY
ncbi:MAG: hypothetical protein ACO1SV_15080 [Fimbriimonas sp.]